LLDTAGVRTEGQALIHLLFAATLQGRIVRGPLRDGQPCFADVSSWLGPAPEPLEPSEGLARLARRYLAGHGPAGPADLARWAGVTLGKARAGCASLADEIVGRDDGLLDLAHNGEEATAPRMPTPRMLGPFDPVLHGWVDRTPLVGSHEGVVTSNGIFRATALVNGRVVGIWGLSGGQIRLELLEAVSRSNLSALERDTRAVLGYLGMPEARLVVSG
jgi:hypothetical protein